MNIFFTSDTHFFHGNIIKHCNRPFSSIEEMNETMIERWNERITNNDDVYFLGDFAWKKMSNTGAVIEVVKRLRGHKRWILGNHDKELRKTLAPYFVDVDKLKEIKIDNQPITLCHYAMLSWNKSHYGAWQLFGHSHGVLNHIAETQKNLLRYNQIDVGVDTNNFYPYSFEEIRDLIKKREEDFQSLYPEQQIQNKLNEVR